MISTLNVHLLDFLMADDFFENNIYPSNQSSERRVAGFISEFYILYKNLALDVKNDISQTLKEKKIAPRAISKIFELLQRARKALERQRQPKKDCPWPITAQGTETSGLEADHDNLNPENDLSLAELKNLLVSHLEIFLLTIRKDKDYSFTVFREFGRVEEFMELLLEFPDDSTLTFQILTSGRPFRYVRRDGPATRGHDERKSAHADHPTRN